MKFTKQIIAFICALAIAVSLICVPAAATEEVRFGKSILSQMPNAQALEFAYDQLVVGCGNAQANISLEHNAYTVNYDEINTVIDLFYRDYPEYFWVTRDQAWNLYGSMERIIQIDPAYAMQGDALVQAQAAFNAQTELLTIGLEGMSDYEKSLTLHNRLATTVTYEMEGYHQTAYGALVGGKAVCAGYSRAYQHLMQTAGLTAWYVTGTSLDPVSGNAVAHAWNLVKVNGRWYYTDVTWDDQGDDLFYAYFNATSEQMAGGHLADDYTEYLPTATATDDNYFVKNSRVAEDFDTQQIAAWLLADHRNTQMYVTGHVEIYTQFLKENMATIVAQMGAAPGAGYGYSVRYIGSALILSLTIEEATHTFANACDAECDVCGVTREVPDHAYSNDQDADCNECGAIRELVPTHVIGDLNDDDKVTDADAVYLLMHTFFPGTYPVDQDCDFNGDDKVTDADAVHLLMYTFFPGTYPLQ